MGSPGCGGEVELPLSLTVGAWLVREALGPRSGARAFSVGPDFASSRAAAELLQVAHDGDIALVVMGDGSARRSPTAPGYVDERAVPFDDALGAALRATDLDTLASIDHALGRELWATTEPIGRLAELLQPGARASVDYDDDPFGVQYWVVRW